MKQAIHLARPFAFAAAALAFATFCRAATCAETTGGGPLTAAAVIARNKAADAAAKPHAEIETWSFTAEGFNGTEQRIVRGDDVLDRETFGPFTTESGKLGGHAWHQNENGYTVSDDGDPPTPAPRHMSLEHVTQPRDLYVVTAVYGGGLTERKSYDAHDFSLVSWDEDAGSDSSHIEYSDFRPGNAGRRKAWLR